MSQADALESLLGTALSTPTPVNEATLTEEREATRSRLYGMKPYLPTGPLFALAQREQIDAGRHPFTQDDQWGWPHTYSVGVFADMEARTGINKDTLRRWSTRGRVDLYTADRAACALGYHPSYVWGQVWWEACELADLELDLSVVKLLRREAFAESCRLREQVEAA